MARVLAVALVALALSVTPAVARADSRSQSRESFLRGVGQAHRGDYAEAKESFLEAYHLFAHPSILLNLGIARWHIREYVAAEQDLVRFLSDDGGASAAEIASARAALAATRAHLGTLRIRILPDGARARLDDGSVPLVPGGFAEVRATAGPHELRAEAQGYEPLDQTVDVPATRSTDLQITLAPLGKSTPAQQTTVSHPSGTSSGHVVLGWSLVSGGGLLALVGGVCGIEAILHASAYNNRSSGSSFQSPSVRSSGIGFRTASDLLFLSAIGAGGVGAYFLLTAGPSPAASKSAAIGGSAGVVMGPGFTGLTGTF